VYRCCNALLVAAAPQANQRREDLLLHYDARLPISPFSGSTASLAETHSPAATVSFFQKGKFVATAEEK